MTFTGRIQPFSRGAMSLSASPLQRMTFETTIAFMRDALISGWISYLSLNKFLQPLYLVFQGCSELNVHNC